MDRRTFNKLAGLTALAALTENVDMSAAQAAQVAGEIVLEDSELVAAFDPASGALTRIEHKPTRWSIERRPALGISFRMQAPMPGERANFILGPKQRAASVEKIADNKVRLVWTNLVSEHAGVLPITYTATVTLKNGELTFESTIENKSSLTVDTIDYPWFGDLNAPEPDAHMTAYHMWTGALQGQEIHPQFANNLGYWGVFYPTKTINSNQTPYCLIQSPQQGIYVAMQDPAIPYLLQYTFEQHPGTLDWNQNEVPAGDKISGHAVHLVFRTCHFVYAHPDATVELGPVVVHPYSGDWHAGLDIYREWRKTWFATPMIPAWARDVHSWQQLQVNGSDRDYRIPYRDIEKYGEECAENGVAAIQLVGWHRGGQDGGEPCLDTDPMLGTWQELHDVIARLQAKGVHMILFAKPVFADMSTDFYKEVLYKYESTDPFGNKYESDSFGYYTPSSLAGIDRRRRAIMDVCCQEYRDIATHEFEKVVNLGADGWLFDEVLQHNGVLYSFSADHGYTPPGYLFSGDIPLVKQFRAAADKVKPDFLFSGEGPGDWLMPYYVLGYYRINWGTIPALRYIDPYAPLMAAVRSFDARDELNLILAYRYIISYEPYYFKGRLTDFPLTLAYGKKIDALRRKYREYLWDAEFRDTLGASVEADGSHQYTVFRTKAGKRTVVIINRESRKGIKAKLDLPNAGRLVAATPEEPEAKAASATLQIPARSVVVVMEQ
ncbi:MAG TPA: DUF6259 domain-containing protein [Terracidiphilus sp.]|nr:DUF6259 domain-containing protein [Terracidiphilus sp.]